MIVFDKVTKTYDNGVTGVKNLSLKVQQGEFVYIVGQSGAGKSTLIKMLYHQLVPTSGQITINDFDFGTMKPQDVPMLRRSMGVVFQDFKLLPRMTVFENVAYAMQVIETPEDDIKPRVLDVLKQVGLEQKNSAFPE